MNQWDIDRAIAQYESRPILGPATRTLGGLYVWMN